MFRTLRYTGALVGILLIIWCAIAYPQTAHAWGNGSYNVWRAPGARFNLAGARAAARAEGLTSTSAADAITDDDPTDEPEFLVDPDGTSYNPNRFGAHDYLLEQAVAQARAAGADLSWFNFPVAQLACDDPDSSVSLYEQYPGTHAYRKVGSQGAPARAQELYQLTVTALESGDTTKASYWFGLLSHHVSDICMPLHVSDLSEHAFGATDADEQDAHHAYEFDLDNYLGLSIETTRSQQTTATASVLAAVPLAAAAAQEPTRAARRAVWFNGTSTECTGVTQSPRLLTIALAEHVRATYGDAFVAAWQQTNSYRPLHPAVGAVAPLRGGATARIMTPALTGACLSEAADAVTSLLITASDARVRDRFFEALPRTTLSVSPTTRQGGETAVEIKVRTANGATVRSIPVRVRIVYPSGSSSTKLWWSNGSGNLHLAYHPGSGRGGSTLKATATTLYVGRSSSTASSRLLVKPHFHGPSFARTKAHFRVGKSRRRTLRNALALRVYLRDRGERALSGRRVTFIITKKTRSGHHLYQIRRTATTDRYGRARTYVPYAPKGDRKYRFVVKTVITVDGASASSLHGYGPFKTKH